MIMSTHICQIKVTRNIFPLFNYCVCSNFIYSTHCNPLKKCWNFKTVFQRNSAGPPEVNIWNHSGILMEFHWNTGRFCLNLPHAFQNYSDEIPLIFLRKEPEFLWNFCGIFSNLGGILMEFLRYFL